MTLYMREQEIREETREETWKEARKEYIRIFIETLKSLHVPVQTILEQLMERFNLTKDEADSFIKQK